MPKFRICYTGTSYSVVYVEAENEHAARQCWIDAADGADGSPLDGFENDYHEVIEAHILDLDELCGSCGYPLTDGRCENPLCLLFRNEE